MQLSITTRHGHLSEASQEKLKGRAEKLGRHFDRLMAIEIIVDLSDNQSPQVDIKVSAEHKHDFVAHVKSESLLAATDGALQKIEQQLRKHKDRIQQKHRKPQPHRQETPAESDTDEE